jgi:DNA mismatch endonuclease (patch repair protein)
MDPATRHRVMASIHKKDTRPELALRRALWETGARGWRCHLKVEGSPDLAFTRWKVAVFVDGVWWHGHPDYLPLGRRGHYWDEKIARNIARDRRVTAALSRAGWAVIRIWDLDVIRSPARAAAIVLETLEERQRLVTRDRRSGPQPIVEAP